MRLKATLVAVLTIILAQSIWSTDWYYAPASASQDFNDTGDLLFRAVSPDDSLGDFPPGGEGWIWLRAIVSTSETVPYLVFEGPQLAWQAWWNDIVLSSSGKPPYNWTPSTAMPLRLDTSASPSRSVLLVKAFVRQGYTEFPTVVNSESNNPWADPVYLWAVIRNLTPYLATLFGLLLFLGAVLGFMIRHTAWDGAMALFGLFSLLVFGDSILALVPDVTRLFSWTFVSIVSTAALPFLLTFWRRSITSTERRDPTVLSVADYFLAALTGFWLIIPLLPSYATCRFPAFVFSINPLPWYISWTIAWALALGISGTFKKRSGTLGSLVILLLTFVTVFLPSRTALSFNNALGDFLDFGLVVALVASVLVIMAKKAGGTVKQNASTAPAGPESDSLDDDDDNASDLLELESLEPIEIEPAQPFADISAPESIDISDSRGLLTKSLRSTMYPESMPWDSDWELASARQGNKHPATGFHDVYRSSEGRLAGMSFMDSGSDSLESMFLAHLVQSEFNRRFPENKPLPSIVRSVHRKAVTAAGAAGKVMNGMIARISDSKITFLPMSSPPLILRRADGTLIPLPPRDRGIVNPPVGSNGFGQSGLKTMSVAMKSGDALMICTPSIITMQADSGIPWGFKGLAASFRASRSQKPEGIVADMINDLKDFTGKDELDSPLQILVIRKR